jgi:hypothetical protein
LEFCLNVESFLQPKPTKNPAGDCFACALTATLRHHFPDKHPDFETVWNYFMQPYYQSEKKGLSNSWSGMQKAVVEAYRDGFEVEHKTDIVMPKFNLNMFSHPWWCFTPHIEYTQRLEGWLRSGWIALTEINFNGTDRIINGYGIDHFVLVDGVKCEYVQSENSGSYNYSVHVVCSVKGAYWIDTMEFLKRHGAAGWLLLRKDERR